VWRLNAGGAQRFCRETAELPDTIVSSLALSPKGTVWAGTPDGLLRFDGTSWRVFDRSNSGLPSNKVQSVVVDHAGKVWAATDGGVTEFAE
jgi:ligand-binding sensor domain-containing protein